MYQSPIEIIHGELEMQLEGEVYKAVQRVGVNVDKEELLKALQYDRGQYLKGYGDGYEKAIEEFAEALINKTKNYEFANFLESSWSHAYATLHFKNCVNEIAKQMKGEQYHALD